MVEIYSLTHGYPDIEFTFKNREKNIDVTLEIFKHGIGSKKHLVLEPYIRSDIIQLILEDECKSLVKHHDDQVKNRNK